ncbi:hypothetical protein RCL1_006517 [Eukaryota sp. TZLM3-RCL]
MRDTSTILSQVDQSLSLLADLEEEFAVSSDDIHHQASVEFLKETIIFLAQEVTSSTETISSLQNEIISQQSVIDSLNESLGNTFDIGLATQTEVVTTNPTHASKMLLHKLNRSREEVVSLENKNVILCEKERILNSSLINCQSECNNLNTKIISLEAEIMDLKSRNNELQSKMIETPLMNNLSERSRTLLQSLNNNITASQFLILKRDFLQLSDLCDRQSRQLEVLQSNESSSAVTFDLINQISDLKNEIDLLKISNSLKSDEVKNLLTSVDRLNHKALESENFIKYLENSVQNSINLGLSVIQEEIPTTIQSITEYLVSNFCKLRNENLELLKKYQKARELYLSIKCKNQSNQPKEDVISSGDASLEIKNYLTMISERDLLINSFRQKIKNLTEENQILKNHSEILQSDVSNIDQKISTAAKEVTVVLASRQQVSESQALSHQKLIEQLRIKNKHLQKYLIEAQNSIRSRDNLIEELNQKIPSNHKEVNTFSAQTSDLLSSPGCIGLVNSEFLIQIFDLLGVPFTSSILTHHSVNELLSFIISKLNNVNCKKTSGSPEKHLQLFKVFSSNLSKIHQEISNITDKFSTLDDLMNSTAEVLLNNADSFNSETWLKLESIISSIFFILNDCNSISKVFEIIKNSLFSELKDDDSTLILKARIEILNSSELNLRHQLLLKS